MPRPPIVRSAPSRLRLRRSGVLLVLALAVLSCDSTPTEAAPETATLQLVSGDGQTGVVASALADPVVVRVVGVGGEPLEGVPVHFSVAGGAGSVLPATATTGSDGRATASWTLGTRSGDNHRVRARLDHHGPSEGILFEATAAAGPPAQFEKVAGDAQLGASSAGLPRLLAVRVSDEYDNPVEGQPVSFSAEAEGASFEPPTPTTDGGGIARSRWILGEALGSQSASVESASLPPLIFSATALQLPYVETVIDLVFSGGVTASPVLDAPQVDPSAPALQVTGQETVVPGGAAVVDVSADRDFEKLYIFVEDHSGHFELDMAEIAPASEDESGAVLYELGLALAPLIDAEEYELRFSAGTGSGAGNSSPALFTVYEAESGPLQVSVAWDVPSDVDLYLLEPTGEMIAHDSWTSSSGGTLLFDSNVGCLGENLRTESITWPDGAVPPSGTYVVRLNYWSACTQDRTRWLVVVRIEGEVTEVVEGVFTGEGEGDATGDPGQMVTTFTY